MRAALDTSFIVAALLSWHERHSEARDALEQLLSGNHEVALPGRVLIESFSVMTRLPAPHRLDPTDAVAALEGTFGPGTQLVELGGAGYWKLLRTLPGRGVHGGAIYDAEILACAQRAKADALITMNRRDFERLAAGAMSIVDPAGI